MPTDTGPPEPWVSFLTALDASLQSVADLYCIGGFAMTMAYGSDRETSDLDVLVAAARTDFEELQRLGGVNSELARRSTVHLQPVPLVNYPEDFQSRLIPLWPSWKLLRLPESYGVFSS